MAKDRTNDLLRRAELTIDPLAEARRLADGTWSASGDPESAKTLLREVDRLEKAERELEWAEADVKKDAREARQRARLSELRAIRRKLRSSSDGHIYRAASLLDGHAANERLPDEQYSQFRRAVSSASSDNDLDHSLAQLEERAAVEVRVTKEPGPYEAGSPNSWVRDVLVNNDPELRGLANGRGGLSDMRPEKVSERLSRHGQDVRRAALIKRDGYGRYVERVLRDGQRCNDPDLHRRKYKETMRELRSGFATGGGTTASASGGGAAAMVPPAFLIDHVWAPFRSPYRAFADQLNTSVPLPEYGMEVYLTTVTGGTTVATEAELAGVSEGDPVATLASSPVVTKAGQVTVSQQFLDRAGAPGIAGDAILFDQIKQQLDSQVDSYALASALTGAQAITNSGTFALATVTGVGGFLKDVKSAKNLLHDTAGVRLRGTHMFATGDFVDFIGSYSDAGGRPVFSPHYQDDYQPVSAGADNDPGGAEGYSGYIVNGLALVADDNIPNSGSNTQIIVCKPSTILQLEGAPVTYVYPPSFAGSLDAVLGVRAYVATVARFPSGVAVIGGSAYAASTFA